MSTASSRVKDNHHRTLSPFFFSFSKRSSKQAQGSLADNSVWSAPCTPTHSNFSKSQREFAARSTLHHHVSPQYRSPLSAYASSIAKVEENKEREATGKGSWLFRLVAKLGGCVATQKHKESNLPVQEFSGISSDGIPYSTASSVASSFSAPMETNPTAITFTMAELNKATQNFSASLKIGQGGFGTVYKGKLADGKIVAIKRAKKNHYQSQLSVEYQSELATLSQIEHLNLVKFIGYLENESERIVVVEYVNNGNLRQHLNGHFGVTLDFPTRLDIAIDVAHAVTYLHCYAERPIIHRDIKSSNVLLTQNFRAKVADFGFSKEGSWDAGVTHVSTQVKGTAGYLDPEYIRTYQLTPKSDVYSFGILVIEIMTGRCPIERDAPERVTHKWVFKLYTEGKVTEALDPKLERTPQLEKVTERIFEVAFQCIAPSRKQRPSMKKAAELLWQIRKDYRNILQDHSSSWITSNV